MRRELAKITAPGLPTAVIPFPDAPSLVPPPPFGQ